MIIYNVKNFNAKFALFYDEISLRKKEKFRDFSLKK